MFGWMWVACATMAAPETAPRTPASLPAPADPCAAWDGPGIYALDLPVPHATKTLVGVPGGPGPHRVVVLLHGGQGGPNEILDQTLILREALAGNAVVVAPSGAGGAEPGKSNWNARDTTGMVRDDVAYLDAVVREVQRRTCGGAVLVMGFSNGAMMANRWLCQGETPDAAVTVSGRIGVAEGTCREPRPHLNFVGTEDDQYRSDHPTTVETLDLWARVNLCPGPALESTGGGITDRTWEGCSAPTRQRILQGVPHVWPRPGGGATVDATKEGYAWFVAVVP